MRRETRTILYDNELKIEAYRLKGIIQPFPNHFHEHYVIGFMEGGARCLSFKNREYTIKKGDIVLFHPGDNHSCAQSDEGTLDYRGLNISKETMLDLAEEVTGIRTLPGFSVNVISNQEIAYFFRQLHKMVMDGAAELKKEENLLLLISMLIQTCGQPVELCIPECRKEIEEACAFMDTYYSEHISLDQICHHVNLSKSTLLRAFTRSKGITPYRYLETVRINQAKKLLEKGVKPMGAALQTGFSDQSHFTNYFTSFTGLAPGVYRGIFVPESPSLTKKAGAEEKNEQGT